MIELFITAIGVFISTSIDYLLILTILFAQFRQNHQKRQVLAGQLIGTFALYLFSLVAASIIQFTVAEWVIGLLGLIPLFIGINALTSEEDDEDEDGDDEILQRYEGSNSRGVMITTALLTIASGGDNLGVYIPYFSGLDVISILIVGVIFFVGSLILCFISERISAIPMINEVVEKYEKYIIALVFIPLGIYIMVENGSLQFIWNLIVN